MGGGNNTNETIPSPHENLHFSVRCVDGREEGVLYISSIQRGLTSFVKNPVPVLTFGAGRRRKMGKGSGYTYIHNPRVEKRSPVPQTSAALVKPNSIKLPARWNSSRKGGRKRCVVRFLER